MAARRSAGAALLASGSMIERRLANARPTPPERNPGFQRRVEATTGSIVGDGRRHMARTESADPSGTHRAANASSMAAASR